MVQVKISSVQRSFGIMILLHTLFIYKDARVTCSTVLVMDMKWIFFRVFLYNDLKFFSDCNDDIQAEYLLITISQVIHKQYIATACAIAKSHI